MSLSTLVPAVTIIGMLAPIGSPISASTPSDTVVNVGQVIQWGGGIEPPEEVDSGVSAIAAGAFHNLAVKNGRVVTWGEETQPVPEDAQSGVSAVAAGYGFSMAIKAGRVIAWGRQADQMAPFLSMAQDGVTAISVGERTIGVSSSPAIWALALKDGRVLSHGVTETPEWLSETQSGVTAVAAGHNHILVIRNGGVRAWGLRKAPGGYLTFDVLAVPEEATFGVDAIALGKFHALALKDGRVVSWPLTEGGLIEPVPAAALDGVTDIAGGFIHSLALKDGRVLCWGQDDGCRDNALPEVTSSGIVGISASLERGTSMAITGGSPVNVKVTARAGRLTVSWSGVAQATGYEVSASPSGLTCQTTSLQCEIVGLSPGARYTVRVVTLVGSWRSAPSYPVLVSASDPPPSPPRNVRAVAGFESATVSWDAPNETFGSPVDTYLVTADPGGRSCTWSGGPLTCEISSLAGSQDYVFRVTASNTNGTSEAQSSPRIFVPPASWQPPRPSNVRVEAGYSTLLVRWAQPSWDGALRFIVTLEGQGESFEGCTTRDNACLVEGLREGKTYSVTVRAWNEWGSSIASDAVNSTLLCCAVTPSAPRKVRVVSDFSGAKVSWEPSTRSGNPPLIRYRATARFADGTQLTCESRATSCTISFRAEFFKGFIPAFKVSVVAVNELTESDESNVVSVRKRDARFATSVTGPRTMFVSPRSSGPTYTIVWTIRDPYHLFDYWEVDFDLSADAVTTAGGLSDDEEVPLASGVRGAARTAAGWRLAWSFRYSAVSRLACERIYLYGASDSVTLWLGGDDAPDILYRTLDWRLDCSR